MSAAVIDHLWQSSVFVLLAWAVTALLRKNGAHLRHWVWFAASLKFLVPFSFLVLIGTQIVASLGATPTSFPFSAMRDVAAPLIAPATHIASPATETLTMSAA